MTTKEFHIGLDLALQQLNSNLFNRLEVEDKDFIINRAIVRFVNSFLDNIPSHIDFGYSKQYYSEIYPLLKDVLMPIEILPDYVLCNLPYTNELNSDGVIRIGNSLVDGVSYKLIVGQTTNDLSSYGGSSSSTVGTIFTCDLGYAEYNDEDFVVLLENGDYIANNVYQSSHYFSQYFHIEGAEEFSANNSYTKYKKIKGLLEHDVSLVPVNTLSKHSISQVVAYIEIGRELTQSVTVERGKVYRLNTLSYVDLSTIGGYAKTYNTTVFTCNTTKTIILPNDSYLKECKDIPVKLIQPNESYLLSENNYVNSDYFLIGEIVNNQIKIYSNNEVITKVVLSYITNPNQVSYDYNIDCNLPLKVHDKVLEVAISSTMEKYGMKNAAATGQLQNKE